MCTIGIKGPNWESGRRYRNGKSDARNKANSKDALFLKKPSTHVFQQLWWLFTYATLDSPGRWHLKIKMAVWATYSSIPVSPALFSLRQPQFCSSIFLPHLAKYYRGSQLQPLLQRWPDWSKGDPISLARSRSGMSMWANSDQYDKRGSLLKGMETGTRKSFFHPKWKLQEGRTLALPWTLSCLCDPQNCCSHIAVNLRMEPTVKVV